MSEKASVGVARSCSQSVLVMVKCSWDGVSFGFRHSVYELASSQGIVGTYSKAAMEKAASPSIDTTLKTTCVEFCEVLRNASNDAKLARRLRDEKNSTAAD